MTIRHIADSLVTQQYRLLSSLESSLCPLTDAQWKDTSLRVALLFQKVIHAATLCVAEPLVGSLALVGLALQMATEQKKSGFQAVLDDSRHWENHDASQLELPPEFEWGASSCEYQQSGHVNCPDSQWATFETGPLWTDKTNNSGKATDLWNRMDAHIEKLKELELDTFRFSIEWSKIEPEQGKFNEAAIQHYVTFAKKLNNAGITPMACLLHFSMPQWVENEGGIQSPKFPEYLTSFAKKVFRPLEHEVPRWATMNEPEIQAFMGYLLGDFPPHVKGSMKKMGVGLKHLMQAHCTVYRAIKTENVQVGLIHNVLRYKAYRWWHPMERLVCYTLTKITHDVVRDFIKTGKFSFKVPFVANEFWEEKEITQLNDFNGINYYSRPLIKQVFNKEVMDSVCYKWGNMTKMRFREDPEGLYEAIFEMPGPIYVTENGISARSDEQMNRYYRRAIYSISQAVKDGAKVLGYYAWSVFRNSEWAEGWEPQNFGLFDYDRVNAEFKKRPGATAYTEIVEKQKKLRKFPSLLETLSQTVSEVFNPQQQLAEALP